MINFNQKIFRFQELTLVEHKFENLSFVLEIFKYSAGLFKKTFF